MFLFANSGSPKPTGHWHSLGAFLIVTTEDRCYRHLIGRDHYPSSMHSLESLCNRSYLVQNVKSAKAKNPCPRGMQGNPQEISSWTWECKLQPLITNNRFPQENESVQILTISRHLCIFICCFYTSIPELLLKILVLIED